jgi:hypothetical protein
MGDKPESVTDKYRRLTLEIAGHKAAIARIRRQLQSAAAAREQLEAECRRRGIRLIAVPAAGTAHGEGVIHGRPE